MALQVVLLLAIAGGSIAGSDWPRSWKSPLMVGGILVLLPGVILLVAGAGSLGSALTPLPLPRADSTLREGGIYRLARHPIYGGMILLAVGVSFLSSVWALVPTFLLVLVLVGKSLREERWLIERYEGYRAYRGRVRRRFLPFVW